MHIPGRFLEYSKHIHAYSEYSQEVLFSTAKVCVHLLQDLATFVFPIPSIFHSYGDHCRCRGGVVGLLEHLVSGGVWGVGVWWCLNQKTKVPSPEVRFLKGF